MPVQFKNPPHDLPKEPLFVYGNSIATIKQYQQKTLSYAVIVNGGIWRDSLLIAEHGEWKVVRSLKLPFDEQLQNQLTLV